MNLEFVTQLSLNATTSASLKMQWNRHNRQKLDAVMWQDSQTIEKTKLDNKWANFLQRELEIYSFPHPRRFQDQNSKNGYTQRSFCDFFQNSSFQLLNGAFANSFKIQLVRQAVLCVALEKVNGE